VLVFVNFVCVIDRNLFVLLICLLMVLVDVCSLVYLFLLILFVWRLFNAALKYKYTKRAIFARLLIFPFYNISSNFAVILIFRTLRLSIPNSGKMQLRPPIFTRFI
jgi:hypothetical protein